MNFALMQWPQSHGDTHSMVLEQTDEEAEAALQVGTDVAMQLWCVSLYASGNWIFT